MNTSLLSLLAVVEGRDMLMPRIIFWVLLILWAIGAIGFVNPQAPNYTSVVRGTNIVIVVLFAILGLYTFGF